MSRLSYRNLIRNPPAATPAPIPNTPRTIGLVSMLIRLNIPPSPIPNKPLFFLVLSPISLTFFDTSDLNNFAIANVATSESLIDCKLFFNIFEFFLEPKN